MTFQRNKDRGPEGRGGHGSHRAPGRNNGGRGADRSSGPKPGLVYGVRPVTEAIKQGKDLEALFLLKGFKVEGSGHEELWQEIRSRKVPFKWVPLEALQRMAGPGHQGVVARLSALKYSDIEELSLRQGDLRDPLVLVLDGVTDVRNAGALARSALAFGAHAIVVPGKGGAALNAEAVKSSAGALLHLKVCRTLHAHQALDFLAQEGYRIIGLDQNGGTDLMECDFKGPVVLVLGSEGEGMDKTNLKRCNELVRIAMGPDPDSLNVSVAGGIALAQAYRSRQSNK